MICLLKGKLFEKHIESLTIEVGGVGYEVFIPLRLFPLLPEPGRDVLLYIQTVVKEDGIFLYGFLTKRQKEVFNLLRLANGVGVKTAFNLLSSFEEDELINAIAREDVKAFLKVPGIGRKTAERIIFELKERVKKFALPFPTEKYEDTFQDVELALISLGYSQKDAKDTVNRIKGQLGDSVSTEEVLKEALKLLMKR